MDEKTLKALEFNKIKKLLMAETQSNLGRKKAENLMPIYNKTEIEFLQGETKEAIQAIMKRGTAPLFGINDLSQYISRLNIGGSLSAGALLKISDTLRVSRDLKKYIGEDEGDRDSHYPILEGEIDELFTYKRLEDEINKAIISEIEIADNASRALANIRREIKKKDSDIREKLNRIINSTNYEKYLQDSVVTIRDGRFVIPVKAEYKSNVQGIVHDTSSSRATVFMEPMVVVNLNNEIRDLESKEQEEIERILTQLSDIARETTNELEKNQDILQNMDFVFAKARLALNQNATEPIMNEDRFIDIREARHPLLEKDKVVPIDMNLGKDFNTLVITGPNTGGKTVSLKTVGLITLMAQSGLHIPAAINSQIGIFKNIYVDIGDEQSIEQSLSTFSSHMTNIVRILDEVDGNSLVLFDELGAGTDPTEGAALAMAILDHLLSKGIRTIATTHYSQLKIYALNTENVVNGSVEFDIESLSPTYRLSIGVPGKSNAFEISRRLGLSDKLISEARNLVSEESLDFEEVLQSMDRDRKEAEKYKLEAEKDQKEIDRLRLEIEEYESKTEEMRERILRKAREEARDILRGAKDESDEIIRDLRSITNDIERERNISIEEKRKRMQNKLGEVESELSSEILSVKADKAVKDLKLGESVKILAFDQIGEVQTLPDEKGEFQVRVGIMTVNTDINSVIRVESQGETEVKTRRKNIRNRKKNIVSNSIDLRGKALDEAILEVDKYIDDAYMAGLKTLEVIHGKGTGVLRDGIRNYLNTNYHVKSHRLGDFNEGGDGVSIVYLK